MCHYVGGLRDRNLMDVFWQAAFTGRASVQRDFITETDQLTPSNSSDSDFHKNARRLFLNQPGLGLCYSRGSVA